MDIVRLGNFQFKEISEDLNLLKIKEAIEVVKRHPSIIGKPLRFKDCKPTLKITALAASDPGVSEEEPISEPKEVETIKIKDITIDQAGEWKIRAKVLKKSAINTHARGKLFKVDLVDDLDGVSMIEGTFYTEETDLFYSKIEEGKTYFV
jgi:hypothetical protein